MLDNVDRKGLALNFYELCCGTYSGQSSYIPIMPRLPSFLSIFTPKNEMGLDKNFHPKGEALTVDEFVEFLAMAQKELSSD